MQGASLGVGNQTTINTQKLIININQSGGNQTNNNGDNLGAEDLGQVVDRADRGSGGTIIADKNLKDQLNLFGLSEESRRIVGLGAAAHGRLAHEGESDYRRRKSGGAEAHEAPTLKSAAGKKWHLRHEISQNYTQDATQSKIDMDLVANKRSQQTVTPSKNVRFDLNKEMNKQSEDRSARLGGKHRRPSKRGISDVPR